MPDTRRHRGPHPRDHQLFAPGLVDALRDATSEYSWLLGHGYAEPSALTLVGNRHGLTARQRKAVQRASASDAAATDRRARRVGLDALAGRRILIDGLNVIIVTESAFSGGLLIAGRDGALRDLASVHGTWRRVEETARAVEALGRVLEEAAVASATWYLDRPVSNSGRLRALLEARAAVHRWPWQVALHDDPDGVLAVARDAVVASADAFVLDRCRDWVDLPAAVVARDIPRAWMLNLRVP